MSVLPSQTLLEALRSSFEDRLRSADGVALPAALLWTDPDGQWKPLLSTLQRAMPELFALGAYAPAGRQGPVIWLKCVVDRTLPDVSIPAGRIPILYLPHVGRQTLTAAGDCPPALQPLIELIYRGEIWNHKNGRDWTVDAFLTSEDSVGLDVAKDARTREAMMRALPLMAATPLAALRGRRLTADDFDKLAVGDPIRDLLEWMSDPEGFEQRADEGRWSSFCAYCKRHYRFDPGTDGVTTAANHLLNERGAWDDVWRRFCDAPQLYAGILKVMRNARPADLFQASDRQPGFNEKKEDELRRQLEAILSFPHRAACDKVIGLDVEHRERRGWVWAQLGESPLVIALEPLARLARGALNAPAGAIADGMAREYAANGWQCDRAAMDALLAATQNSDKALVEKVVRALYAPWLDRTARRFQELVTSAGSEARKLSVPVTADSETCVLFADGLRFDIAAALQERLEARGVRAKLGHRIAPFPTVTATAKPVASPMHEQCSGRTDAEEFNPVLTASNQPLNASRLRDALARMGVEVLEVGQAKFAAAEGGGWTESGRLDELGHSLGIRVTSQIEREINDLLERITSLLNAGWSRVRVVTDHGWLLLPGGLPKIELSPHLVATKWSRCATVKGNSAPDMQTFPWYWNPLVRIATPPGIGAFVAGTEYAHGGISLQECVIPDLVVERGAAAVTASIRSVTWRGMRCRVAVEAQAQGLRVDLRRIVKLDASTIVAVPKDVGLDGEASLVVDDDRHEGLAAFVVVLDRAGKVLDQQTTTVGEGE